MNPAIQFFKQLIDAFIGQYIQKVLANNHIRLHRGKLLKARRMDPLNLPGSMPIHFLLTSLNHGSGGLQIENSPGTSDLVQDLGKNGTGATAQYQHGIPFLYPVQKCLLALLKIGTNYRSGEKLIERCQQKIVIGNSFYRHKNNL